MGVPKFFRWMSERYPKMNQRTTSFVDKDMYDEYFDNDQDRENNDNNNNNAKNDDNEKKVAEYDNMPMDSPDALSTCGLSPEIDRLYIDMNGVLHGCSHNNNDDDESGTGEKGISQRQIFTNVCFYLDRIVKDIAKPKQLVYMAIDGVAPRAKMNQQRARRYRGSKNELEKTIYDEIVNRRYRQKQGEGNENQIPDMDDVGYGDVDPSFPGSTSGPSSSLSTIEEAVIVDTESNLTESRWSGKFETKDVLGLHGATDEDDEDDEEAGDAAMIDFHSNTITPGTEFFQDCVVHLEHWIQYKLSTDPAWQHLEIIFSDSSVPGEGEHKIMDFMRQQRSLPTYDPNLRHCIVGQDGDLILLGLATHEPNLVLLRERVLFDADKRRAYSKLGVAAYLFNVHFEWLHMSVLRDYLMFDFETGPAVEGVPWDRERTIDDFVFLTFFVGNDFLPGLPALDIADNAFDLLFHVYLRQRDQWYRDDPSNPYLTHKGEIVSGKRLQAFLTHAGVHETAYYENKKERSDKDIAQMRLQDERAGREQTVPEDDVLQAKEEEDRANYRAMLQETFSSQNQQPAQQDSPVGLQHPFDQSLQAELAEQVPSFAPVMSVKSRSFRESVNTEEEQKQVEQGFISQMGTLLQQALAPTPAPDTNSKTDKTVLERFNDQDLKGRYYYDKFGFTPVDAEKHLALRKAYMEGLVWTLRYYYQGCVSWEWFYPYHYGPMMSDLVSLDKILDTISFDDPGEPLKPFEQLMACMPPSSASLLPKPYRWLLTDSESPIKSFYPQSFTVDMNGKRWPWEAVVLLPFIDSTKLVDAARSHVSDSMLTAQERARNTIGVARTFRYDPNVSTVIPDLDENVEQRIFAEFSNKADRKDIQLTKWYYERPSSWLETNEPIVFEPKLLKGVETPKPGFPTLLTAKVDTLWRRHSRLNIFGRASRYKTANLTVDINLPPTPPLENLHLELVGSRVHINYPYLTEAFVTAITDETKHIRGKNAEKVKIFTNDESKDFLNKFEHLIFKYQSGEGFTGTGGWILPKDKIKIVLTVRPLQRIGTVNDGIPAKFYANFEVDVPLIAATFNPDKPDPRLVGLPAALEADPYFVSRAPIELTKGSRILRQQAKKTQNAGAPMTKQQARAFTTIDSPVAPSSSLAFPIPVQSLAAVQQQQRMLGPGLLSRPVGAMTYATTPRSVTQTADAAAILTKNKRTVRGFASVAQRSVHTGPSKTRVLVVGLATAAAVMFGGVQGADSVRIQAQPTVLQSKTIVRVRPTAVGTDLSTFPWTLRGGADETAGSDTPHSAMEDVGESSTPPPLEFAHGTTTLSFKFKGGIIAAVDSRATLGNFVGSKTVQKVLPINR